MQFMVCIVLKILKLFKLYVVIKSENHIVYKVIYKMVILKGLLLKVNQNTIEMESCSS